MLEGGGFVATWSVRFFHSGVHLQMMLPFFFRTTGSVYFSTKTERNSCQHEFCWYLKSVHREEKFIRWQMLILLTLLLLLLE